MFQIRSFGALEQLSKRRQIFQNSCARMKCARVYSNLNERQLYPLALQCVCVSTSTIVIFHDIITYKLCSLLKNHSKNDRRRIGRSSDGGQPRDSSAIEFQEGVQSFGDRLVEPRQGGDQDERDHWKAFLDDV